MNRLQICQLIIIRVDADTEEQSGVAAVDDFGAAFEFDEV